jgi:hypothetical protein
MQQMNRWFIIRLIMVVAALGIGLSGNLTSASSSVSEGSTYSHNSVSWFRRAKIYGIIGGPLIVLTFCAVGIGYKLQGVGSGWKKPSWSENPYQGPSQPFQGLHFIAVMATAEGAGGVLRELLIQQYQDKSGEIILTVGLGFWIGLRLALLICVPKDVSAS